jgi:muconate cycloisomerase
VVTETLRYEGTRLIVPTGPGLGFELDRDKLEALRGPLLE